MPQRFPSLLAALAVLACAPALRAQVFEAGVVKVRPLSSIGGPHEEAERAAQLRGEEATDGFLLRSPSSQMAPAADRVFRIWVVGPEMDVRWNSKIPFGLNDGSMWSGRGANDRTMAGLGIDAGPVRLIVAPELNRAENRGFPTVIPRPWLQAAVHPYIPPWQYGDHSIDLPYRMGHAPLREVRLGQSSLSLTAGPVAVGASTENQWWGPGVRSALVLGNQGPGVGHLFVRTARPLRTRVGQVEARWISGALRESPWFPVTEGSGWRSLSAAAVVLSPARTVSVGLARSVYAPTESAGSALGHAADVLTRWKGEGDPRTADPFEQITALFARVVIPGEGAELYAEWARTRLPINLRDLMQAPEHTQGYTLGLQWLRPAGSGELRLQAEHTYLEESPTYAWRSTGSWYASAVVPQGYTHEGQLLGAGVGPGGSGQWVALDWLRGRGRAGAFAGRIRWAQDSYYDKPGGPNRHLGYDMSAFGGIRGAIALGPLRLDTEYTLQKRWNYLFQSTALHFDERFRTTNVVNHTFRLGITTRPPRLGPARTIAAPGS